MAIAKRNPASSFLARFLARNGRMILDGGLATELERRGYDLRDPLWSARVLLEAPEAIEQVHYDYLAAGADCIITSSYQASFAGLEKNGFNRTESENVFALSVQLATKAREKFWSQEGVSGGRPYPLVAASIGPYGAAQADGSEFHGNYGISRESLLKFHGDRVRLIAGLGADLLACETMPLLAEAEVLVEALRAVPQSYAWISFACRDERHTVHGEPIRECAARLADEPQIAAIGVNCTAPCYIASLIAEIRSATAKPIVVYPNSGETWNQVERCWTGRGDASSYTSYAREWYSLGAQLIGGCCRTGPEHIRALANTLGS